MRILDELGPNWWDETEHFFEIVAVYLKELDVVERCARGGSRSPD